MCVHVVPYDQNRFIEVTRGFPVHRHGGVDGNFPKVGQKFFPKEIRDATFHLKSLFSD